MSGPIATLASPRLPTVARGWPLLPVPDADGRIDWPVPETSVRQMIEVVLRTAPGEQLMRPQFGAGLDAMLHAPNDVATRARMHDAIIDALKLYEPRIRVDRCTVEPSQDFREVLVTIAYRILLTGAALSIQARVPVAGAGGGA